MENKLFVIVLFGCVATVYTQGVATSHQSIVSGEGWRYGYGIAHGPHGIGHSVGESFPHGYGGFGTYAPAFGYGPFKPIGLIPPLPRPIIVPVRIPQYILPQYYYHRPQTFPYYHPYYYPYRVIHN